MNKKVLVLGGGVAGSSMAYYLTEKGYEVTLVEKNSRVGGLARTCYYSGHPYEFGPHIWFWPGGEEDPINNTIVRLTNNELFHIDRRLFTYVEADRRKYRYPVHYQDIDEMPERETIHRELNQHRDNAKKLIQEQLPELGQCTFADYFTAAIGQTLYQKFMANYTWKMWNIPGDELQTSMVWADRFHHAYTKTGEKAAPRGAGRLRSDQVRRSHARQRHPLSGVSEGRVERGLERDGGQVHRRPRPRGRDSRRAQAAVRAHGQRREVPLRRLPHGLLLDRHRRPLGRGHAALHRPHDDSRC